MNDIWYLDPVDSAKLYDETVDATSYDEVKRCYEAFIANLTFDLNNGYISLQADIVKDNIIERHASWVRPNIINANGSRVLTDVQGPPGAWVEKGYQHISIGNYNINIGKMSTKIKESMVLNKTILSDNDVFPDDLEYID